MQSHTKLFPVFLVVALSFQGCVSGPRDLARFSMAAVYGEEPVYRAKATEFVRYAQAGEVDKMLDILAHLAMQRRLIPCVPCMPTKWSPSLRGPLSLGTPTAGQIGTTGTMWAWCLQAQQRARRHFHLILL